MNYDEIENLNRPIKDKEIKSVIKDPSKTCPEPDNFTSETHQTLKKVMPILLRFFQNIEEEIL